MKEDTPITPTPRPADPFTAQDGIRLFAMIDSNMKRISSALEEQSNRLANIQRQGIELLNLVKLIEAESAESRFGRLEIEIEEAKRERDIAERNLAAVEEKIAQKQNIKEKTVDTGERLKVIATEVVSDAEQKRRDSAAQRWDDLKWTMVKTVVTITVGGAVTGIIAFIVFLVNLYWSSKGGP